MALTYNHLFVLPAPSIVSEERMERNAEWFFDRLDKVFMDSGFAMSQAEYDALTARFRKYEAECDRLRHSAAK